MTTLEIAIAELTNSIKTQPVGERYQEFFRDLPGGNRICTVGWSSNDYGEWIVCAYDCTRTQLTDRQSNKNTIQIHAIQSLRSSDPEYTKMDQKDALVQALQSVEQEINTKGFTIPSSWNKV